MLNVFVKLENMSIISLEYMQNWKVLYSKTVIPLLSIWLLDSPKKIEPNWIKTQYFQLKLFIAVTLKYGQGHWKWYEQVKLNE